MKNSIVTPKIRKDDILDPKNHVTVSKFFRKYMREFYILKKKHKNMCTLINTNCLSLLNPVSEKVSRQMMQFSVLLNQ